MDPQNSRVVDHLQNLQRQCDTSCSLEGTTHLLWTGLRSIWEKVPAQKVMLVIDGIDRMPTEEQTEFMNGFLLMNGTSLNSGTYVKILVAGRTAPEFRKYRENFSIRFVDINSSTTQPDIELVVRDSLSDSGTTLDIVKRSEGSFLWAKLALASGNSGDPERGLMPAGFRDFLDTVVDEMSPGREDFILCQILTAASTSLVSQSLAMLLRLCTKVENSPKTWIADGRPENATQIYDCQLITFDDGIARFFHSSVREYLLHILNLEDCHAMLAAACLTFATYCGKITARSHQPSPGLREIVQIHPLLAYAIENWSHHFQAGRCEENREVAIRAKQALLSTEGIAWMERPSDQGFHGKEFQAYLERNLAIRRSVMGFDHSETLLSMLELAYHLQRQGIIIPAVQLFTEAKSSLSFRELSPSVKLQALKGLGRCFERQNLWAEAEQRYILCLEIVRSPRNEDIPEALAIQNSLAWVIKAQGRQAAAERLYDETYNEGRRCLPPGHMEVRLAARELVDCYQKKGRDQDAREILLADLKHCTHSYGHAHLNTYEALSALVLLLRHQGKMSEAEGACRDFFEACQQSGVIGLKTGHLLASIREDQGDLVGAERILAQLYHEFSREGALDLDAAASASIALANHYTRERLWNKALTVLERHKQLYGERASYDDQQTIALAIARCNEGMGRLDEARLEYKTIIESRKAKFGWSSRIILTIGQEVASHHERLREWDKATEVYKRMHSGFSETMGKGHRYTLACQRLQAGLAEAQSDWAKARDVHNSICNITVGARGRKHHTAIESSKSYLLMTLRSLAG
jgi:tetratricopeptide (TPR) repeat protein